MEKYMRLSKICILIIFFVFNSSVVLSDYENTNGKPIEKSFQDLLKWATDDIETKIDYIEISNDWESLDFEEDDNYGCLLYTSPSPRDCDRSRMPSSA